MINFKIFLESDIALEYHDTLNTSLWKQKGDEYLLKDEVADKLIHIAHEWKAFAKIPQEALIDIVLTGGNANYNWTKFSDIDLHLVIDKQKLLPKTSWNMSSMVNDIINDYLKTKKQLWGMKHDIRIAGFSVEIYAQDSNELYHEGQGVYSLLTKKWICKPVKGLYNFNNDEVLRHKIDIWMKRIDNVPLEDLKKINLLKGRLSNMRRSALEKGGEFSQENLIFKALRNSGYLNKLSNYQRNIFDKELSL